MAGEKLGPPRKAESVVIGRAQDDDGAPCIRLLLVGLEGERMTADFQLGNVKALADALMDAGAGPGGLLPHSFFLEG
jgi:hypothetical protein